MNIVAKLFVAMTAAVIAYFVHVFLVLVASKLTSDMLEENKPIGEMFLLIDGVVCIFIPYFFVGAIFSLGKWSGNWALILALFGFIVTYSFLEIEIYVERTALIYRMLAYHSAPALAIVLGWLIVKRCSVKWRQ